MVVQTFYKSKTQITALAGVVAAIVAPQSLAAQLPLQQQTNPANHQNPVRTLPASTIFMSQPPTPNGIAQTPGISAVLGKAFRNEDLHSLYGAGSFGACETSSRVPSFFEKNYSNFAYSCMNEHKNRQAVLFDERFQSDPTSQGYVASPLGGRLQWTSISGAARDRLLQRSINDLAQKNKTLADIIQGRISIDFGFGKFWSPQVQSKTAEAPRPRYVVELESSPNAPQALNKRKFIASVGRLPEGSLDDSQSPHWLSKKPRRSKRVIRETFEPTAAAKALEQQQISANNSSPDYELSSAYTTMQYLSRMAGLQQIPFTKVNMRAERRMVDGRNQFALRATESQELMFAEFPDIRSASPSNMVWGYRVPWKRHALNVTHNEASQERTTAYSYRIDDSNKTDISYNHSSRAVSAGFVISF
ncbi:MAG: hypothetical protein RI932_467 [Pseudomonadota bacterium]|jgi:hypothetical protein